MTFFVAVLLFLGTFDLKFNHVFEVKVLGGESKPFQLYQPRIWFFFYKGLTGILSDM